MMNFRVTAEHAPLRCDICHQADCFDAVAGACSRCSGLLSEMLQISPDSTKNTAVRLRRSFFQLVCGICCLGFSLAAIGGLMTTNSGVYDRDEALLKFQWETMLKPSTPTPRCSLNIPIPDEISLWGNKTDHKERIRVIKGKAMGMVGPFEFWDSAQKGKVNFFGVMTPGGKWEVIYIPPDICETLEPGQLSRLGFFLQIGLAGEPQVEIQGYRDRLSKRFYATKIRFPDRSKKSG